MRYLELKARAQIAVLSRRIAMDAASERAFKEVHLCITMLARNTQNKLLHTQPYRSFDAPYAGKTVFDCHCRLHAPAEYRVFWCYGPGPDELTILAVTGYE